MNVSLGKEVVSSKVLIIVSAARVCVMFSYCVSVPLGKEVVSSSVLIRVCVILSYRVSVPLGRDVVSSSVLTTVSVGNVCVILSYRISVPRGKEVVSVTPKELNSVLVACGKEVVSVTLSGVKVPRGSVEVTRTVLAGKIEVCVTYNVLGGCSEVFIIVEAGRKVDSVIILSEMVVYVKYAVLAGKVDVM